MTVVVAIWRSAVADFVRSAEVRVAAAKYSQSQIDAVGKKGQAFGPDDDGHFSYPIGDHEDVQKAIKAVGRGAADHDAIRRYIIRRAKAIGATHLIPDDWNADGSLKQTNSAALPR